MSKFKLQFLFVFFIIISACQKNEISINPEPYWEKNAPEQQGMDQEIIDGVINQAANMPNFYALLIVKNNKLVVEEYFKNHKANDLLHLRSITKNFTSALTGIAIKNGSVSNIDTKIEFFFPDLLSEEHNQISLRHLLNMNSGLSWNEAEEIDALFKLKIADPVETILNRELSSAPGTTFNYNSVSPHIVSRIVSNVRNRSFEDFAIENLFIPLGIQNYKWDKDPNQEVWGGGGLQLTARDLAKFGQLYLNNGVWNEKQIIPWEWIELSKNSEVRVPNSTTGYSLQWWIADNLDEKTYFGQGYGGQALMLIPERKMLVVAMQEFYVTETNNSLQWRNFINELFPSILAASN